MIRAGRWALVLLLGCAGALQAQEEERLQKTSEPPLEDLAIGVTGADVAEAPAQETPEPEAETGTATEAPPAPALPDEELAAVQAEFDAGTGNQRDTEDGENPLDSSDNLDLFKGYALRGIGGLCVVIALILLLQYLATRFGKNTPLLAGTRLGSVMGRIYLNPKASLHYVKSGGRILVLGVTPQQITFITEYDEEAFNAGAETRPAVSGGNVDTVSFLEALKAQSSQIQQPTVAAPDDDIASLRGDIQRLQQYLRDESNDKKA